MARRRARPSRPRRIRRALPEAISSPTTRGTRRTSCARRFPSRSSSSAIRSARWSRFARGGVSPSSIAGVVLEDPPFHTMGRDIGATPYRAQFAGMQEVARHGGDVEAMTDALAEIRLPAPEGEVRLGDVRDRASLQFSAECLAHVDPEIFTPLIAGRWLDGFDYESLWSAACRLPGAAPARRSGGRRRVYRCRRRARATPSWAQRHIRFAGVGHQIHRTRPEDVLSATTRFRAGRPSVRCYAKKAGARSERTLRRSGDARPRRRRLSGFYTSHTTRHGAVSFCNDGAHVCRNPLHAGVRS